MDSGGINQNTVGNAVWTNATRNLTRLGPTLVTFITQANQSLGAVTGVDFRPGANTQRKILVGVKSSSGVGVAIRINDGTNTYQIGSLGAAGGAGAYFGAGDVTVGIQIFNTDGAQTGVYGYTLQDWAE